ncbi:hypothetical protein [Maledivibacter halophilus]|uniref:GyrI-like small molecule binding domain-containing protein n=1 Tax=Maledivibacter halophilus TaxID=36842 RepID=A0A1T5KHJ3_9FIRM|nr:hypothetical protein [Maledivibacter halophilus]SKC62929.1 hypothetical protein SAMN02194393_01800 [Maledivibacter halophilus]
MPVVKIILIALLVIIVGIILFLNYVGFFSKIVIEEKKMGPYVLVYEEHKGDYKGTRKIQDNIYDSLLNKYGIETFKGFGVYYDDPKKVSKEELRSIAGCILEESDYNSIKKLKESNFKVTEIPKQNSIAVEFPFKNAFSVFIGIMKVYPEINKFVEKNGLNQKEIMEVYDVPAKKIIYIMNNSKI